MTPFRTSLTARLVSASIAVALAGSGLSVALGAAPSLLIPMTFIVAIMLSIFGLVVGVLDHPLPVVLLALLLPCALWPYVMVVGWMLESMPALGWLLVALATVPVALTVVAPRTVREPASKPAPAAA
jgi:hypothetical protein